MREWTIKMNPDQAVPSGTSNREAYVIKKLLDKRWQEDPKTNGERPNNYEPARCWSAYVLGAYWNNAQLKPVRVDTDDTIRSKAIGRKEQRKKERIENKAQVKKVKAEAAASVMDSA